MSAGIRSLQNAWKLGLKQYLIQLHYLGDTKIGTLVGIDKFGNKFYENNEEWPLRTRWVDYAKHDLDAAHVEPLWHGWLAYSVDTPPHKDPLNESIQKRAWTSPVHHPNYTATRGAFKTYSTTRPKLTAWEPMVAARRAE